MMIRERLPARVRAVRRRDDMRFRVSAFPRTGQ